MTVSDDVPRRLSTGVEGLDAILGGGLHPGGIYIVSGRPGAGKTILSNQMVFAHAKAGGRAVYATLLAETHERLIAQLRTLSFFDPARVGKEVVYLNGLEAILDGGLAELLQLVRGMVRDHDASLLVLDGIVTASALAPSPVDYKRFISELQTWVAVVGCTVLLVASGGTDHPGSAEQTMVDGIIELSTERSKLRTFRHVTVTKLRGSAFVEGSHAYLITPNGLRVFPRFEARPMPEPATELTDLAKLSTGVPGLDGIIGGGLVAGSTTLLLAPSGCGKTVLSLHFLAEGARRRERVLYFGLFEQPTLVIAKGDRLGLGLGQALADGLLRVEWRRPSEIHLDAIAEELLAITRRERITRIVFDGFAALHASAQPHRVAAVFATLNVGLLAEGATMIITDETRELFVQDVEVPTPFVSALFHNILFLRRVENEEGCLQASLAVMKTRDSGHDSRIWEFDITDAGIVMTRARASNRGQTLQSGIAAPPRPAPKRKTQPKEKTARASGSGRGKRRGR